MEERDLLIILYDYYSALFNDRERECFEDYYFDNLSLAEIALNRDKSRNAIHKSIKSVCSKLYEYEDKIGLYNKSKEIKEIINLVEDKKIKERLEDLLWRIDYQFI